jgi:hypothetical protein
MEKKKWLTDLQIFVLCFMLFFFGAIALVSGAGYISTQTNTIIGAITLVSLIIGVLKLVGGIEDENNTKTNQKTCTQIALVIALLKKNKQRGNQLIGEGRIRLEKLLKELIPDDNQRKALLHDAAEEIDKPDRFLFSPTQSTSASPTPAPEQ